MFKYLHILTFVFLSLSFSFSQNNCKDLVKKIKKETNWNIINYFPEIDKALKSNCSREDKIALLMLKAEYYMISDKTDSAQIILFVADKYNAYPHKNDSIDVYIRYRRSSIYSKQKKYFEAYKDWTFVNNYLLLHKQYKGLANNQIVLGNIFLYLKQNKSALKAYNKAKKYAFIDKDKKVLEGLYGAYSSYWAFSNEWDSSIYYLSLSERYAPIGQIDLSRDFQKAALYMNKGELDNARLFFSKTINDAKKANCPGYIGVGQYGLAITYIDEDPKKAFKLMKNALDLIDNSNPDQGINICECILDNFKDKEYAELLPFFEKRKKKLVEQNETLNTNQVAKMFEVSSEMSEKLLLAQKDIERKKIKELNQSKRLTIFAIVTIAVLIILIFAIFYYLKLTKSKKELELKNEQQKMVLNNSIVTITNFNAMADSFSHKLKQIALQQTSKKLSDNLFDLAKQVSDFIVGSNSKELKDLDLVIQSINDGFVKKLCQKYQNLSSNEITLAIYLRMNFSTKQIADLKGTSENSVDVSRSRLRNKLGIKGENIDLSNFLNKI